MGEHCAGRDAPPPLTGQRLRLWEIRHDLHCAVLGTCLSYAELVKIGRKAGFTPQQGASEYEVHACFVRQVAEPGHLARLIHKLLDRKYRSTIEVCRPARSESELDAIWTRSVTKGDIAGSYWALVTHPLTTDALLMRSFGDVHMLSHLSGAANRADRQRLHTIEDEYQALSDQLADAKRRMAVQAGEHRRTAERHAGDMQALSCRLRAAETAEAGRAAIEARLCEFQNGEAYRALRSEKAALAADLESARRAGRHERQQCADLERKLSRLRQAHEDATGRLYALGAECAVLETMVGSGIHGEAARAASGPAIDLCGRHIAYVGGRTGSVSQFRILTENLNGRFSHHDGGIEDNTAGLGRILNQADAVLCPVDCVSHGACLMAKRFCKRTAKPFVPLRSAGLSSFAAGLHRVIERNGVAAGMVVGGRPE